MLDRDKVLNWWTGRISDGELAAWTGMAPRAVGIVLSLPNMRSGVIGGGRGTRHSRRILPKTRNAVAIVQAMAEAGLTFELATNIIAAMPFLTSIPTENVDLKDSSRGIRSLPICDPTGGWLATDIVPWHIWERFPLLCFDATLDKVGEGDLVEVFPPEQFKPNTLGGTMIVDRANAGLAPIELRALSPKPVYSGEIDRIGLYSQFVDRPEAIPAFDSNIILVDGKWIIHKSPTGLSYAESLRESKWDQPLAASEPELEIVGTIEADKKNVLRLDRDSYADNQQEARFLVNNHISLQNINVTLAVRRMKRRAYGLPVTREDPKQSWTERIAIAQKYDPPASPYMRMDY